MEPNDPTWSGSPVPSGGEEIVLSRNEIESLAFKASRGAGMSWGMAEEAGKAVAWLAQRGVDALGLLLAHLRKAQGKRWSEICPEVMAERWLARPGQALCPFALGAVFCDHMALAEGPLSAGQLETGPVGHPVLVLPFLAEASAWMQRSLCIQWDGKSLCVKPDGSLAGDLGDLCRLDAAVVFITHGEDGYTSLEGSIGPVARATIAGLDAFALKTTVPASERSRAGAGSATGDND